MRIIENIRINIRIFGLINGIKKTLTDFINKFERCSLCGTFLHLNKIKNYYGGIDDEVTKKKHFVCYQCYGWFYNVGLIKKTKRIIKNNKLEIQNI